MIGGGANFASRGAVGMAGGRLVRPSAKAANLLQKVDEGPAASAAGAPRAPASVPADAAETVPVPTGQNHHGLSKKIHNELEKHLRLKGVYLYKDRRFETRAIDSDAHRGYQKWHRDLDGEIADHIGKNSLMNQEEFESYLRSRYAQPDLLARFRNGL
jgi:hypothetical protein